MRKFRFLEGDNISVDISTSSTAPTEPSDIDVDVTTPDQEVTVEEMTERVTELEEQVSMQEEAAEIDEVSDEAEELTETIEEAEEKLKLVREFKSIILEENKVSESVLQLMHATKVSAMMDMVSKDKKYASLENYNVNSNFDDVVKTLSKVDGAITNRIESLRLQRRDVLDKHTKMSVKFAKKRKK